MLFVLWLLYVVSLFDRLILTMLVEPIKKDLDLSDLEMGILLGPAFAVSYAIFGWVLGWAADRYSRRLVIYWGATLWSFSVAASALARSFAELLFCRIGVGVGEASLTPAAYLLLGDRFPKKRLTTAMSLFQSATMVGTASAFAIGGLLIHFGVSLGHVALPLVGALRPWQLTMALTGVPSLILALLVFTFREPPRRRPTSSGSEAPGGFISYVWSERWLLGILAAGFCLIVTLSNSLLAWVPTYMGRHFEWTPDRYGPILGSISLLAGAAMIVKGWIVDLLYSRGMKDAHIRFYTWLVAAAIPLGTGAFFVTNPVIFLIFYGILQVLVVQFVVYLVATLQLIVPAHLRGQLIGAFMAAFTIIGAGVGPLMTAALTDLVFGSEAMLGMSLAVMGAICLPGSWILLRIALRSIARAVELADAQPEPR